jgi:hypothetical protein
MDSNTDTQQMKQFRNLACLAATLMLSSVTPAFGNDSAASTGAGGIQLRREANISMQKERLTISESRVTVEYEFLNETDKDITTEVEFPIPPYGYDADAVNGIPDFNDFHLWVDGKELKYHTDIRAKVNGKDYTDLLKSLGVDIESFDGDYGLEGEPPRGVISRLPRRRFQQLVALGLVGSADGIPRWKVVKTYYWTQTFPAHKMLYVRHAYTPMIGFETTNLEDLAFDQRFCVDPSLQKALRHHEASGFAMAWVDYILTTANSWKTPIKDFTLVIDRRKGPAPTGSSGTRYVSLCWDGSIKKLDADHLIAHVKNFVPTRELKVAFISMMNK